MSDRREVDRLLDRLERLTPPAGLRTRALRAAEKGLTASEPPASGAADPWESAWKSRGLWAVWLAAVLLLVALHVAITPGVRDYLGRLQQRPVPDVLLAEQRGVRRTPTGMDRAALERTKARLNLRSFDRSTPIDETMENR